jgi:hypothetical protein
MIEQRHKLVKVRYSDIIDMFTFHHKTPEFIYFPYLPELPQGYRVVSVHDSWAERCFEFCVYHESWPIVPDGKIPPRWGDQFAKVECTRLIRYEDDPVLCEAKSSYYPDGPKPQM